jgi:hypothetical protein
LLTLAFSARDFSNENSRYRITSARSAPARNRLLRPRRERPCGCGAAEQRDELTAFDHSIHAVERRD